MADEELDASWVTDLETALLDGCDFGILRNICKGEPVPNHLRSEVWKICLSLAGKSNSLSNFNGLFDLPEQSAIRQGCHDLIEKLGNEEEDKVALNSDLEEIITFYSKSKDIKYEADCGWLSLLQPILALKLPKNEVYNMFYATSTKYIPRNCKKGAPPFHLFRLLLQYHEPQLSSFLDTKRVTSDMFAQAWFRSLFSETCDLDVILSMWDVYFQQADPFLMFFLGLVILVNAKEQLMEMECETKLAIADKLLTFPNALEAEDIKDFCDLAQYYASKTPQSFRRDYQNGLFNHHMASRDEDQFVAQALCLPVAITELLQANSLGFGEGVRFFVVDCRPAEQYNAGHLPTAFHLDANLMLQNPIEFSSAVDALFEAQKQSIAAGSAAGGEHLCFVGSGREEEDQYVHMVVANFLQQHKQFISIANGGYSAIHKSLEANLTEGLTDHNPKACIVCNPEAGHVNSDTEHSEDFATDKKESIFDKLTAVKKVMQTKSAVVKDKLFYYIKNEQGTPERHVSSSDKGKPYRNMASVFSIGDDEEDDDINTSSGDERKEIVSLEVWKNKPEVKHYFKCEEVRDNGFLCPSHLLVTDSHLFILGDTPNKKGMATIQNRRSLSKIVKITSKKKHPELITFKYGENRGNSLEITEIDRFLIPEAGEATKAIKIGIITVLDALEG